MDAAIAPIRKARRVTGFLASLVAAVGCGGGRGGVVGGRGGAVVDGGGVDGEAGGFFSSVDISPRRSRTIILPDPL